MSTVRLQRISGTAGGRAHRRWGSVRWDVVNACDFIPVGLGLAEAEVEDIRTARDAA